jgi:hypothetical protein
MLERIRKRVPTSTWVDILKVMHLYAQDVLQDRDLTDMLVAACASPSNDLAVLIEEFMLRCVPAHLRRATFLAHLRSTACPLRCSPHGLLHACNPTSSTRAPWSVQQPCQPRLARVL